MDYEEEKQLKGISSIKTHKTFWFLVFGIVFLGVFLTMYFIFNGIYQTQNDVPGGGNIPGSEGNNLNPYDEFSGGDGTGYYPHENPNCKLYFIDNFQEISMELGTPDSTENNVIISVGGYSDVRKVSWSVENPTIVKLKPVVGGFSKATPLAIGKTTIIINDTTMNSCELPLPFEVIANSEY